MSNLLRHLERIVKITAWRNVARHYIIALIITIAYRCASGLGVGGKLARRYGTANNRAAAGEAHHQPSVNRRAKTTRSGNNRRLAARACRECRHLYN